MRNFAAAALCAALGFASPAGAAAISLAGFSGTETVVNFNGLGNAQVFSPTFSVGGVTFTNNSNFGGIQYWQPNAFGIGGSVALGQSSEMTDITVNLGTAWQRVGINAGNPAVFGNFGPANFRVSFFDSTATLLGSVTNASIVSQPFFGWENSGGILSMRIVEISGPNGVSGWLDNLRFENSPPPPPPPPPAPAPEPASLALLGLGLAGLAARRRKA